MIQKTGKVSESDWDSISIVQEMQKGVTVLESDRGQVRRRV